MENKLFYSALIFSFLLHGVLIYGLSLSKEKKNILPKKSPEIVYQILSKKSKPVIKKHFKELEVVKKKKLVKKNIKLLSKKQKFTPSLNKSVRDISKLKKSFKGNQKQTPKIIPLDRNRKVTIPLLKSEKITNPKYLSYNQTIRQKIRQRAYSYINHENFEAGNVYLTFVVSSKGSLREVRVVEEKTFANEYLRKVGIRSIKESSPFPPFPKDLKYPELTFNVVISFEVKE